MWPVWAELVTRGALITSLVTLGALALLIPPPPSLVNRPAPAAVDAIVAFVRPVSEGEPRNTDTVMGVNARDGATRWTRTLDGGVMTLEHSLLSGVIRAQTNSSIHAVR